MDQQSGGWGMGGGRGVWSIETEREREGDRDRYCQDWEWDWNRGHHNHGGSGSGQTGQVVADCNKITLLQSIVTYVFCVSVYICFLFQKELKLRNFVKYFKIFTRCGESETNLNMRCVDILPFIARKKYIQNIEEKRAGKTINNLMDFVRCCVVTGPTVECFVVSCGRSGFISSHTMHAAFLSDMSKNAYI